MWIKLKEARTFRNTVEGEDIKVGYEPVEVTDSIGQYLIDNFPLILEETTDPEEE